MRPDRIFHYAKLNPSSAGPSSAALAHTSSPQSQPQRIRKASSTSHGGKAPPAPPRKTSPSAASTADAPANSAAVTRDAGAVDGETEACPRKAVPTIPASVTSAAESRKHGAGGGSNGSGKGRGIGNAAVAGSRRDDRGAGGAGAGKGTSSASSVSRKRVRVVDVNMGEFIVMLQPYGGGERARGDVGASLFFFLTRTPSDLPPALSGAIREGNVSISPSKVVFCRLIRCIMAFTLKSGASLPCMSERASRPLWYERVLSAKKLSM